MLEQGLVHSYFGEGKGKTTAALGLGIRAIGNGLKVCMIQFLKTMESGEVSAVKALEPDFRIYRLESPKGFFFELNDEEKNKLKHEVEKEFELAERLCGECDVLILDEIFGVLENNLLSIGEVVGFIRNKPERLELVLTGRVLPEEIKEISDYVSEIKDVKHPGRKGIPARRGIEF